MKIIVNTAYGIKEVKIPVNMGLFTNGYFFGEDGDNYHISNVLAVKGDLRPKYVRCLHCNNIFQKGAEELHYKKQEAKRSCLKCDHCKIADTTKVVTTKKDNGDGTCMEIKKTIGTMYCTKDYDKCEVSSQSYSCKYNCRLHRMSAELMPKSEILEHFNDEIATEAAAIRAGAVMYGTTGGYTVYKYREIKIFCNSGIIMKFKDGCGSCFKYSHTLKKFSTQAYVEMGEDKVSLDKLERNFVTHAIWKGDEK